MAATSDSVVHRDFRTRVGVALTVAGAAAVGAVVLLAMAGTAWNVQPLCTSCHLMNSYSAASGLDGHEGISCSACHSSDAPTGLLIDGVRLASMLSRVGNEAGPASAFDDTPCRKCHEEVEEGVLQANGIAVRHSDFLNAACTDCHGGTGHRLEGRWYSLIEMAPCMSCHRASSSDPEGCRLCHLPGGGGERVRGTAWQVTHGPQWRDTHGMGDLAECIGCHSPGYCVGCHDVRVPHQSDWLVLHGKSSRGAGTESCRTCHERKWCSDCHQVEMPHPPGFLPVHGKESRAAGDAVCVRCHESSACDVCHFESSHPSVPGAAMGHTGAGR